MLHCTVSTEHRTYIFEDGTLLSISIVNGRYAWGYTDRLDSPVGSTLWDDLYADITPDLEAKLINNHKYKDEL